MIDLTNIPAVDTFTDTTNIRVVLYQSGTLVHASLNNLIDAVLNGSGILLEGDMASSGSNLLLLEGTESGTLLLN
ncbi:hypothetical protein EN828_10495 [Mesorhizobium sp. M2D.F.Ca.ET.185.01.1.1]|uniref:hypothetical protein n=1 Tax=unclassified Mesorhizobium TaxID=325217 RepID=UPI000FCBDEB0|nr:MULTISPECIES: hypothetical protein [unclassified Mesorhizobium]TGT97814.1 hypothetical protein EN806_48405 [bacterium M00.F.Ca.ET.163.01.1.1]TGV81418.1 hypothetical protein EN792_034770 [Mesorhizobium sp. M00.F.Ca.ET.149.01.1.1]TGP25908.1 hypothetical protein EN875_034425 [Mesorhizobium sp. M2D.F.Ca.ET.232.01.1.1]TGQ03585.1 hypothetical protein EN858_34080 [Mesorhizobium sp. M4B.F.Ca.ET.215.01.1.1]TGQ23830.1 hypothetical protein EN863_064870 [Mesorhizobium sp. M00.F.Ca.ET.220.01.1.1]